MASSIPKNWKILIELVAICCVCEGEGRTFGYLQTEDDSRNDVRGPTALSRIEVSIAAFVVVAFSVSLCGFWSCIQRRRNRGAHDRHLTVNHQPSSHNSAPAPVNLGHVPTAYDGDVTICPTFRDGMSIVHGIRITELPKCFQKGNLNSEETLVDQLNRITQLLGPKIPEVPVTKSTYTYSYQDTTALLKDEMHTEPENLSPCYINEKGVPFIVTEEPCLSTLDSFWKLVWQEKVPVIINLSERKENSTTSSPLPTSEQRSQSGNLNLTLMKATELPEYSLKEVKAVKVITQICKDEDSLIC